MYFLNGVFVCFVFLFSFFSWLLLCSFGVGSGQCFLGKRHDVYDSLREALKVYLKQKPRKNSWKGRESVAVDGRT